MDALRAVGFDAAALAMVVGSGVERPEAFDAAASRLQPKLAAVVRSFVLGEIVDEREAVAALGDGFEAGVALGTLRSAGDGVRATLRIVPHDILLLASDFRRSTWRMDTSPRPTNRRSRSRG